MYYYAKINNLSCVECNLHKKGIGSVSLSVSQNDINDGNGVLVSFKKKNALSVYKEVFSQLHKYYAHVFPLLECELRIYATLMPNYAIKSNRVSTLPSSQPIRKELISSFKQPVIKNNINFFDSRNTLYIMKKTSSCQNRNHDVKSVTGILKNLKGFSVKINVNYCEKCKRFFINRIDFDEFCKRHGIMLGNFSIKGLNFNKGSNGMYKLADESPLHYCGYNVNKQKGLSESDRHKILANIIDFNIIKKTEIIEYLHFYINNIGNRANMNLAVSKWEDDLYFVNNYRINKQKSYKIDKIKQR